MSSPFKFLDAYTKQDQHLFFGRDDEIEELYQRVFKSNLMLVYGASGTGKTSLIQCGLSSKFSDENWFSIYIRRQNDINKSLLNLIKSNSITEVTLEDLDPDESEIVQRVEGLYFDHFKPIYLIFDQLEELFILGEREEQNQFYSNIRDLVNSKIHSNIILIIREEYIAALSRMEEIISKLFDNRVRIEKMRKRVVKEVIEKSCTAIPDIDIDEKERFLNRVIENLTEDELTVELTYLQVYLDKLYRNSEIKENVHIFNMELLEKTGKVHDVLTDFLEEQVQLLPNNDLGWKILKVFITKDGTKKSASLSDIIKALENHYFSNSPSEVKGILMHFVNAKVLTTMEDSADLFEFTHDSLAIKTFEKLDAKERNLFDIQSLITQQYNGYVIRNILLDKENLQYITPYLKDIKLNKNHSNFIEKSRKEINKNRKRRIAGIVGIIVVLTVLTAFSILRSVEANMARKMAEEARKEAIESLQNYLEEQMQRKELEISNRLEKAILFLKAGYKTDALIILDEVKKIDSSSATVNKIELIKKEYGL
jgi:hypothetical protein